MQSCMSVQIENIELVNPEFGSQTLVSNQLTMENTPFSSQTNVAGLEIQNFLSFQMENVGSETEAVIQHQLDVSDYIIDSIEIIEFKKDDQPSFENQVENLWSETEAPVIQTQLDVSDYVSDPIATIEFEREALFVNQKENINQMDTTTWFENQVVSVNDYVSDQMGNTRLEIQAVCSNQKANPNVETPPSLSKPILCWLAEIIIYTIKEAKHHLRTLPVVDPEPRPVDGTLVCVPLYNHFQGNKCTRPCKRRRMRSEFAGQLRLDFQISVELFILYALYEKPSADDQEELTPGYNRKLPWLPLLKRLNGWTFERRRRGDGRYDTYYHHKGSKMTFRSTKEVVNFILFNTYPRKQRRQRKPSKEKLVCARVWKKKKDMGSWGTIVAGKEEEDVGDEEYQ